MKPVRIYRPFGNPAFPLQVKHFSPRRIMPGYVNLHWHPELELLYSLEGEYEIYSDSGNFPLLPNEICLIPNGKVHGIRSLTRAGEYYSIRFSADLIQMSDAHFFQQTFVEPLRSGALDIPNKFSPGHNLTPKAEAGIHQIIHEDPLHKFLGLMTFCAEILPHCKQITTQFPPRQIHPAALACMQYMEANYPSRITLEELADHVHLHPNYLCAIFKRNCGQTIFAYLNNMRVHRARDLLSKGQLSISQVAEQVGFSDMDHFSRTFKQVTGISPSAYRKAYNEN